MPPSLLDQARDPATPPATLVAIARKSKKHRLIALRNTAWPLEQTSQLPEVGPDELAALFDNPSARQWIADEHPALVSVTSDVIAAYTEFFLATNEARGNEASHDPAWRRVRTAVLGNVQEALGVERTAEATYELSDASLVRVVSVGYYPLRVELRRGKFTAAQAVAALRFLAGYGYVPHAPAPVWLDPLRSVFHLPVPISTSVVPALSLASKTLTEILAHHRQEAADPATSSERLEEMWNRIVRTTRDTVDPHYPPSLEPLLLANPALPWSVMRSYADSTLAGGVRPSGYFKAVAERLPAAMSNPSWMFWLLEDTGHQDQAAELLVASAYLAFDSLDALTQVESGSSNKLLGFVRHACREVLTDPRGAFPPVYHFLKLIEQSLRKGAFGEEFAVVDEAWTFLEVLGGPR